MKSLFNTILILTLSLSFCFLTTVDAQYFGKNKPKYTTFDFEVLATPHFDLYHYMEDEQNLNTMAQWMELWYDLHQRILQDTFITNNPFVLYNNHGDFQQTSTISGPIGVSTGGVTEGLKNRVVMPVAMSNQQTFHVMGHELVHAFQFHMLTTGDSTGLQSLGNLPLWIVEGMAEYMSLGRVDPHTAMWMRNAVKHDNFPSLEDLSKDPRFFPYRYGQAFWAFLTGLYGDDVIRPLFTATAKYGIQNSVPLVLGIALEDLSEMWENTLKEFYGQYLDETTPQGEVLFSDETTGQLNIAPSISPNGRYVIFLSEQGIFTTDLYLAEVRSGKILNKVASKTRQGNIDHLNYLESAGTWSPNSRQFAFVIFSKGKNKLVIKDAQSGDTDEEFFLKGVPAFSNPTWSPDGRTIIVNGLVEGQPDLYAVDVRTRQITQLTDDIYSELQPNYSFNGNKIAFATDRVSYKRGRVNGKWKYNLAVLDLDQNLISNIELFPGANNMNPVWDENENIFFLSDRDGFRNVYRFDWNTRELFQLTDVATGVSGITPYSPAVTVNRKGNIVLYNHYNDDSYNVMKARTEALLNDPVDPMAVDMTPAVLPPGSTDRADWVNPALDNLDQIALASPTRFEDEKYKAKFKLDYIGGGGGIGIGTSSLIGTQTGLVGGIDMLFSDVLGNHKLFGTLALNGEIQDFGGQVAYLNSKGRIGWGASVSHIPSRFNSFGEFQPNDTLRVQGQTITGVDRLDVNVIRIFRDQATIFTHLPFSQTHRLEGGVGFSRYSSSTQVFSNYYTDINFGRLIFQDRNKGEKLFDGFNLYNAQLAYVGDNSYFGLTSPLQGYRYRMALEHNVGEWTFSTALADFRKYWWFEPFNISVRGLHFARYGQDANNINLGYLYSIDPTLVRGYNTNSLDELTSLYDLDLDQIRGSKIAVGNIELRLPFTGPEQLALIRSNFLFTQLAFFVDGAVAWSDYNQFEEGAVVQAKPIFSTGVALRVNLFGAMIIEPYYARPIQEGANWDFGVNFIPGW